jgi:hypothetical protein
MIDWNRIYLTLLSVTHSEEDAKTALLYLMEMDL